MPHQPGLSGRRKATRWHSSWENQGSDGAARPGNGLTQSLLPRGPCPCPPSSWEAGQAPGYKQSTVTKPPCPLQIIDPVLTRGTEVSRLERSFQVVFLEAVPRDGGCPQQPALPPPQAHLPGPALLEFLREHTWPPSRPLRTDLRPVVSPGR